MMVAFVMSRQHATSGVTLFCICLVLMLAIAIQHSSYLGLGKQDAPFDPVQQAEVVAPFIFDSIFSLLKQWPNSYSPNGRTMVPGTIPAYTPLFHAHYGAWNPKRPKYFALDV
jgi:hypothetical protein